MAIDVHTTELRDETVKQNEQVTKLPLQEVVARVGRDSRHESRQYLDETVVPHGGE